MEEKADEGAPSVRVPREKDPRILDCDACGEPLAAHEGVALWFRSAGDVVRVNVRCLQKGYERQRARAARMEAAIRWACGEQPLADGRWFDSAAFGHIGERRTPPFWWRSILRLYSGLCDRNAAEPPPDSSAALREARRLLQSALDHLYETHSCSSDVSQEIAAFLGQPAAGPSSPLDPGEQNGKD